MGKVLLVFLGIIVLLGIAGGSYYFGAKSNNLSYQTQVIPSVTLKPSSIPSATPVASASPTLQAVIAGGVYTFAKYQISFPPDWQQSRSNTVAGDIVTLKKGNYELKINQGAFDGGACSYPDKPVSTGISQSFNSFVALKDQQNTMYRRGKIESSGPSGQDTYEVCAFSTKNNVFQEFTPFGRIDYVTPVNADAATLIQMDSIISSLKSQ
jgi:hypothetical protein